jgi:hypothetical protein
MVSIFNSPLQKEMGIDLRVHFEKYSSLGVRSYAVNLSEG